MDSRHVISRFINAEMGRHGFICRLILRKNNCDTITCDLLDIEVDIGDVVQVDYYLADTGVWQVFRFEFDNPDFPGNLIDKLVELAGG